MNLANILLGIGIFGAACGIFWWAQQKPAKKTQVQAEVAEPEKKSRLTLTTVVAGTKTIVTKIKPHFQGTFGVSALVILFCAAGLLWAVSGSGEYLWFVVPVLLVMAFLIVKVSNTVKNEFARGVIYVVIVIVAGTVILPRLPGSTPAQPIQYTANQLNELDQLHRACPGEMVNFTFLPTYQEVNRSQCLVYWWIGQNDMYVQDAEGNEHGPYCERPGCLDPKAKVTHSIRALRSARGSFVGQIKKVPDYSTLSFYYGRR